MFTQFNLQVSTSLSFSHFCCFSVCVKPVFRWNTVKSSFHFWDSDVLIWWLTLSSACWSGNFPLWDQTLWLRVLLCRSPRVCWAFYISFHYTNLFPRGSVGWWRRPNVGCTHDNWHLAVLKRRRNLIFLLLWFHHSHVAVLFLCTLTSTVRQVALRSWRFVVYNASGLAEQRVHRQRLVSIETGMRHASLDDYCKGLFCRSSSFQVMEKSRTRPEAAGVENTFPLSALCI